MSNDAPKTKMVCECKEIDEDGNVIRTFPLGSEGGKLKRTRTGVSTWNEQLKTVTALMKEVLGGKKAESGLQLKIAGVLKEKGQIENPTREQVSAALQEARDKNETSVEVEVKEKTSPKRESIQLEEVEEEDEDIKIPASNRMQKQGGGGCGCTGGMDMMKGGACSMWPASGGKRKGRKATRKGRKATRKGSRKGSRKTTRKGSRKSRTTRK